MAKNKESVMEKKKIGKEELLQKMNGLIDACVDKEDTMLLFYQEKDGELPLQYVFSGDTRLMSATIAATISMGVEKDASDESIMMASSILHGVLECILHDERAAKIWVKIWDDIMEANKDMIEDGEGNNNCDA